ncbi:MAG TPA: hypothetical protein VF704_10285 [Allosphingosinicella sp.]|jgi:hypothetical protein
MASRFIGGALPGRNTLDVPVAALAGLSVAFAAFAAPADLLGELVGSSGIAAFLPAAEPPLGLNARLAIGAAGAVIMFALAFLLLRWLDRFGTRRDAEPEPDFAAPRLRRRDFHPDAPPRPPLSAAAELSEPDEPGILDLAPEPPESEPAPRLVSEGELVAEERAAEVDVTAPESYPTRSHSLAELLDRLEQGLARRRIEPAPALEPPAAPVREAPVPAPQVFPEPGDDRLRSAIDSLQRLAARQD